MWKCTVLLLLALPPSVNSKETPTPRMCAFCLEKDCAIGVRRIYPAGNDTAVWLKESSPTEIPNCPTENLKADAPCKMANGSLVQPADNPLQFEGTDSSGVWRIFKSQNLPCAGLGLSSSSKPSPTTQRASSMTPSTNLTNSTTSTPSLGPAPVTGNDITGTVSACILVAALIVAGIVGGLIYKKRLCNCQKGGGDRRPDENATEMGLLNGQAANGNLNKVH